MRILFLPVVCYFLMFLPDRINAQDGLQLEIGAAIVRFPKKNIPFSGDRTSFQIPRITATKVFNEQFSLNMAVSFNSIKVNQIASNKTNYFSFDSFLRYSFVNNSRQFTPYVFAGISLVSIQIDFKPGLNTGIGNTFWFLENFGLNTQVMYKVLNNNISHFQYTGGLVYSINFGRKRLWD